MSDPSRLALGRGRAGRVRVVVLGLPSAPDVLSAAERAVADAAVRGATNAEIARDRGVTPRTVANQLASAYAKLGVSGRSELAARLAGMGRRRQAGGE